MEREIDKVIAIVGSQAKLAKALGLSANAISKWAAQGFVPPGRAMAVAALVEGKHTSDGESVSLVSLLLESALRTHSESVAENREP